MLHNAAVPDPSTTHSTYNKVWNIYPKAREVRDRNSGLGTVHLGSCNDNIVTLEIKVKDLHLVLFPNSLEFMCHGIRQLLRTSPHAPFG